MFSASLSGLTAHPARYGWDWNLAIQAESGYGCFAPAKTKKLIQDDPAVTGWSEFAFAQLPGGRHGRPGSSACNASSARFSPPPPAAARCPPLTRSSWAR